MIESDDVIALLLKVVSDLRAQVENLRERANQKFDRLEEGLSERQCHQVQPEDLGDTARAECTSCVSPDNANRVDSAKGCQTDPAEVRGQVEEKSSAAAILRLQEEVESLRTALLARDAEVEELRTQILSQTSSSRDEVAQVDLQRGQIGEDNNQESEQKEHLQDLPTTHSDESEGGGAKQHKGGPAAAKVEATRDVAKHSAHENARSKPNNAIVNEELGNGWRRGSGWDSDELDPDIGCGALGSEEDDPGREEEADGHAAGHRSHAAAILGPDQDEHENERFDGDGVDEKEALDEIDPEDGLSTSDVDLGEAVTGEQQVSPVTTSVTNGRKSPITRENIQQYQRAPGDGDGGERVQEWLQTAVSATEQQQRAQSKVDSLKRRMEERFKR